MSHVTRRKFLVVGAQIATLIVFVPLRLLAETPEPEPINCKPENPCKPTVNLPPDFEYENPLSVAATGPEGGFFGPMENFERDFKRRVTSRVLSKRKRAFLRDRLA